MKPETFFKILGEDGMENLERKNKSVPPYKDVEIEEILVLGIEPTQEELEYLISWGEVARALEYARKHGLRATPLKYLVSRVVSFCCDTDFDLVEAIKILFWKETI